MYKKDETSKLEHLHGANYKNHSPHQVWHTAAISEADIQYLVVSKVAQWVIFRLALQLTPLLFYATWCRPVIGHQHFGTAQQSLLQGSTKKWH
jgi:hypothetical protein